MNLHRLRLGSFLFVLTLCLAPAAGAKDWFVNAETGSDENDGAAATPLFTAQVAVNRAEAGDRIVLLPEKAVFRQSIALKDGTENLVIEGNGVTLTGADPMDDVEWETLGDDLHRTRLPKTRYDRHLLVVDGSAERMGRKANGSVEFPSAAELLPGQFRWDDIDEESGWLTVKGNPENLEWATRVSGIRTSGKVRNVKVFNLDARHFLNDGFNIHGDARGLQFFNIAGYENFDEGFSAHDTCQCWITDGRFFRNENAVADVNEADTYYTNCHFSESSGTEVLFQGGRHGLTDCRITGSDQSVSLSIVQGTSSKNSGESRPASLAMRNVTFDAAGSEAGTVTFGPGSTVQYDAGTAASLAEMNVVRDENARVTESLHRTFPIGRTSTGEPIMAWAAGDPGSPSSDTYRIVHFGKHSPAETTSDLSPNNDWLGLMEPLAETTFPPRGDAFQPDNSASHAIWRWIGLTAPDAVFVPDTSAGRSLGAALQKHPPAQVGMVKVFLSREGESDLTVQPLEDDDPVMARSEMRRRVERSPETVGRQLAQHYGHRFSGSYIQALAVIARMKLDPESDAEKLARAHLETAGLPKGGGDVAGTLLYAEIDEPWASRRVLEVASLAFDDDNEPLEAMPGHNEMSDAVFMACPVLTRAGKISGEPRFHDQCVRQLRFIQERCLRDDGLYRHSPLNEAAWGRGNGFSALGLALVLDHFPADHPERGRILDDYRQHLEALAKHQDDDGMWHQIIDLPDSYAEFTATCMIAYAISRGIRNGWLSDEWRPRLDRAWEAVKARIGTDGLTLYNVCTGTGKQPTREDYYLRKAILGPDDRGGAMALMLAVEMAK
ncbi:MAG: glycoside hydrolase family 88 protein [Verrucomicrobiales bacterium]